MTNKVKSKAILWLSETESTNNYVESKIQEGHNLISRDLVVADFQTRGRGNGKSHWESEKGKNLLFSVFYVPHEFHVSQQFYLNMAVSLGLLDFIKQILKDHTVSIKWPNDIYIDNKKIAGMLIKNFVSGPQLMHSILGIGLNVNQEKFKSNAPNPISLIHYLDFEQNREQLLHQILDQLDNRLNQLEAGDLNLLKSEYLQNLFAFRNYQKYLYEDRLIKARITGISEYGSLQLEVATGDFLECDLKEIKFIL